MRSFRIALLAASMLAVVSLQAQTVDEIINKHMEALGGKDKVASINTLHTEYDVDMNGNAASGVSWAVNGKAFKNEVSIMGQKLIQCFTANSGWSINPFMGQTTPTAMKEEEVKSGRAQIDLTGPFFNYAAKGNTIELLGKETVDGKPAFKFRIKTKEGQEITSWIDATTYYLLKNFAKTTVNGVEVETTMSPSNYKKTENGYVVPFNIEFSISTGLNMSITNKTIEINKEIDSTMFEMPKQ